VIVRAPAWDDLEDVVDLMAECDLADVGTTDMTAEELRGAGHGGAVVWDSRSCTARSSSSVGSTEIA
jgi:hypothetical protein